MNSRKRILCNPRCKKGKMCDTKTGKCINVQKKQKRQSFSGVLCNKKSKECIKVSIKTRVSKREKKSNHVRKSKRVSSSVKSSSRSKRLVSSKRMSSSVKRSSRSKRLFSSKRVSSSVKRSSRQTSPVASKQYSPPSIIKSVNRHIIPKTAEGETITLTFGDCAENHRGMQKIGEAATSGLTYEDLVKTKQWYMSGGYECFLIDLRRKLPADMKEQATPAYVLIVRNGTSALVDTNKLLDEQLALTWDKKAFMYGRVVDKKARHNLCYGDFVQNSDFENKKGTIVPFSQLPSLSSIRRKLGSITGEKLVNLQCEGNRYYDVKKTYIGFHGDTERRIVVAVRLGSDFPIHYQWFQDSKPIGDMFSVMLKHGDIYYMSDKAVGYDWKRKKSLTLRHAAGPKSIVKTW